MEEFFQTISHYFIACASSGLPLHAFTLLCSNLPPESEISTGLVMGVDLVLRNEIPVKFHAHRCILMDHRGKPVILVIGGYGELAKGRGKASLPSLFDMEGRRLSFTLEGGVEASLQRLFYAAFLIGERILLFGGRASPLRPSSQVTLLSLRDDGVLSVEDVPCSGDVPLPCWRFAAALCRGGDHLFIHGGLTSVPVVNTRSYSLDLHKWVWSEVTLRGDLCGPRMCHTLSEYEGRLYMFGGLDEYHTVLSDLFEIDLSTNHIRKLPTCLHAR
ncbi:protein GLUTELIN PRECURSOR ACCUMULATION 3-like [Octopus sinensis]|uniref:Protein GLUTELIN PRECURSOR ACCUMULATION 3-like n=1 Tax=Octopus sinensis TaxID=2607531 RepID=A0A6P7TVV4_9MOLL|nr:protein GLUTELIN PRECURSOR ACCUMULATION 3-like [Octopus sinensis]